MFSELFKPFLHKVHPCSVEEVRHSIQKEKRIIDTLEPVMSQHKLVIAPDVIREDFNSAQNYPLESQLKYQLIYQLSRITRDRGAITQDDRLDALAIAVAYWTEQMAQDAENKIKSRKEELMDEELKKLADTYFGNKQHHRNSPNWL
jgi:hypothetical protein